MVERPVVTMVTNLVERPVVTLVTDLVEKLVATKGADSRGVSLLMDNARKLVEMAGMITKM